MSTRGKYDPDYVRQVSIAVYRIELDKGGSHGDAERMIAQDGDSGEKLATRALAYDRLTRSYLDAIEQVGKST